jgi:hypothetical protein
VCHAARAYLKKTLIEIYYLLTFRHAVTQAWKK